MKSFPIAIILISLVVFPVRNTAAQNVKELYERATVAFYTKDYETAIKLYQAVLEAYPNLAPAYNYLGLSQEAMGTDPKEIIWLFKRAISIDPKFAPAYENLAKTYYSLEDYDQAELYCNKALEIDPNLISAHHSLGWIYLLGKSNPPGAINHFSEIVAREENANAYFGLGLAYFMDNQGFKVLDIITKLKELNRTEFAQHLENMVRSNRYQPPPIENVPLLPTKRQPGTLVKDSEEEGSAPVKTPEQNILEMKVRLKEKFSTDSTEAEPLPPAPAPEVKKVY